MYSVRILRQAIKDIADLPKGYARLVSEHIDRLRENPRLPGAKKLRGTTDYRLQFTGGSVPHSLRHRRQHSHCYCLSSEASARSLSLIVFVKAKPPNIRSTRPRCALGYRPHAGGEVASPAGLVSVARAAGELNRYDAPVQFIRWASPAGLQGARTVAGGGVLARARRCGPVGFAERSRRS